MAVAILTEAGGQYGFGHLTRCLALAQSFKQKGFAPVFYLRGSPQAGRQLLRGFTCHNADWLKKQPDLKGKIVILDSYHAGKGLCEKIYTQALAVLFFDDNNRISYPGGLVLNSSPGYKKIPYPRKPQVTYLLGPEYHPLRRDFWEVPDKKIRKQVKTVLITCGGRALDNLLWRVVEVLKKQWPRLNKKVILPKGFLNTAQIKRHIDPKTELIYHPDASGMKEQMLAADICVCAGGQTLGELARIGVPSIGISLAQNQVFNLQGWQKNGFIEYAGNSGDKNLIKKLVKSVTKTLAFAQRKKMSRAAKARMDGEGANRVTGAVLEQTWRDISLRRAAKNDCRDIWLWRNHPRVRKICFDKKPISYTEHKKWFSAKLRDADTVFFVAQNLSRQKTGQVRFDRTGATSARININLNPEFFGRGLGSLLIRQASRRLLAEYPEIKQITAQVLKENEASRKAFKKAGYVYANSLAVNGRKTLTFKFLRP